MTCKKVLYISEAQKNALENIKTEVKDNGGKVSVMRLMQDGISIFLEKYKEQAVVKYSPIYEG